MKGGLCPRCGSHDVYRSFKPAPLSAGNWIFIRLGLFRNKVVHLTHYACGQCYYIESFVADEKSMQNIRDEWTPMSSQKSKRKNDKR